MAKKKIEPEPQAAQRFRNRIKELRMVKASELKRNPKNWKTHPDSQKKALEAVLTEVGYGLALPVRETDEGLLILDGHARADISDDQMVPVLVLDVNEKEGDLILATLDPLAGLAETDDAKLRELMASIETENEELMEMLDAMVSIDNESTESLKKVNSAAGAQEQIENFLESPIRQIVLVFDKEKFKVFMGKVEQEMESDKGCKSIVDVVFKSVVGSEYGN